MQKSEVKMTKMRDSGKNGMPPPRHCCGLLIALLILGAAGIVAAFEWPQRNVTASSFASSFAQLRGGLLSGSLVFRAPQEVFASDPVIVLALLREPDDGADSFFSPLGNAVIIDHNDDMITVYGNLRSIDLADNVEYVEGGRLLGVSGVSGWQPIPSSQGTQGLEFQVIDTMQNQVINPRILMPRLEDEAPFRVYGLSLENKRGDIFRLAETAYFPLGVYLLYYEADPQRIPYRTMVSINGTVEETLTYDAITTREGRLAIRGKRYFGKSEMYPDGNRMLFGEMPLLRGRNSIRVIVSSLNGQEGNTTYMVENY
jgi:hypothetical protein